MIGNKKVTVATGHQPRKGTTSLGDWRPGPSQQSAAVKPTQPAQDEMTMRDQFAMAALNGLTGGPMAVDNSARVLAELSYLISDQMMEARKENN